MLLYVVCEHVSSLFLVFLLKLLYIRLIVFHFHTEYEIYSTVAMTTMYVKSSSMSSEMYSLVSCDEILKDWKNWFSICDTCNPHMELSEFVCSVWLINRKFTEPFWFYRDFIPSRFGHNCVFGYVWTLSIISVPWIYLLGLVAPFMYSGLP